jgi:DNA (cytosine-5)-methyltransferase 1
MALTATDLFCGAGGSSLGAEWAGIELVMAANHWQVAIDVHQHHFPRADHDVADISQADPRRYPRTDILLASPECTNHSQARGVSRKKQDASLWDAPDPSAERSRATMWDVPRFAEQLHYDVIVVENVVEATKWVGWRGWCVTMEDLGYTRTVLSHNSMHHGVPQSRDRIYVVFTKRGVDPDLELELPAWCARCDRASVARQAWKNGRTVGRYRQAWVWSCTGCGREVDPGAPPAASIIDWDLTCPRIGDRARPLAERTRARILAGMQKYGWAPIITAGAGHTHERTPGNRSHPVTEPLPAQHTTAQHALVDVARRHHIPRPASQPLDTVVAGGTHHGLLMRNCSSKGDGGEMVTPTDEPARSLTTKGHQSLLVPYTGQAQPVERPVPSVTTRTDVGFAELAAMVDDCGFRMLEPHEISAAMAFPKGYIPSDISKTHQVKLAGNAVTPPVMQWITGRIAHALSERR